MSAPLKLLSCIGLACFMLRGDTICAQRSINFFADAGLSASFIQGASADATYQARYLPHGGISVIIPVEGAFALRTGIEYAQKGWRASISYTDSLDSRDESIVSMKLHAIAIPLQLAYSFRQEGAFGVQIAGGMAYYFLLKADGNWTLNDYHRGRLINSNSLDWHPEISLIPDGSRLKNTYDNSAYYRFNAMLRGDISVSYRKQFSLRIFGEMGLTELSAAPDSNPAVWLASIAASVALALPKARAAGK